MRLPKERKPSVLSNSLSRRLNQYALLAGSAGVSLLALPRSAQAEIVYTPANVTVQAPGGFYGLDLDNDGIADFVFRGYGDGINSAEIDIDPVGVTEKAIQDWRNCLGTHTTYCSYAAALPFGAKIPGRRFAFEGIVLERILERANSYYLGFWQNVRNHFLGLFIVINGQGHYGWARVNVRTQGASITAQITGYAYETIADKPIGAGQTAASPVGSLPGSLGSLARGAK